MRTKTELTKIQKRGLRNLRDAYDRGACGASELYLAYCNGGEDALLTCLRRGELGNTSERTWNAARDLAGETERDMSEGYET